MMNRGRSVPFLLASLVLALAIVFVPSEAFAIGHRGMTADEALALADSICDEHLIRISKVEGQDGDTEDRYQATIQSVEPTTDPATDPDGTDPATDPDGADPAADPDGTDPAADPDGTDEGDGEEENSSEGDDQNPNENENPGENGDSDEGDGTTTTVIAEGSFCSCVQDALDHVRSNGDGSWYRVLIPAGVYDFGSGNGFHIYSNTIFDARDNVEIHAGALDGQLIRAGRKTDAANDPSAYDGGYDDYQNIMVLGGTWSGTPLSAQEGDLDAVTGGCNVRFGHAQNIYLIGMNLQSNYHAHHMELGAVRDCLVWDCSFSGAYGDGSIEALQLDVTHRNVDGFSGYWPYDDLCCCDCTVENCSFTDLHRGVGSHHIVLGSTYDSIRIANNYFENLDDRAINAAYFTNSEIVDNTMSNVNSGINIASMIAAANNGRGQTYLKNDASSYPVETCKGSLVVRNNKISLDPQKAPWTGSTTKYGIKLGGGNVADAGYATYTEPATASSAYATNDVTKKLSVGKYYYSGITVANNRIDVYGSASSGNINAGIYADLLASSTISGNTIDLANCNYTNDASRGIVIKQSKSIQIKNNTILHIANSASSKGYGIDVRDNSTGMTLSNNSVDGTSSFGVYFVNSKGTAISGNTISGTKSHGIYALNATVTNMNSNRITGTSTTPAALILSSTTATNINSNVVAGCKVGIAIQPNGSKASTVTNVSKNSITGASDCALKIQKSTVAKVDYNTFKSCKKCAARFNASAIVKTTAFNTFTSNALSNKPSIISSARVVIFKTKSAKVKAKKKLNAKNLLCASTEKGTITWKSANSKIAKVNKKGVVVGVKKGTTTIIATKNKRTAKITITVS